MTNITRKSKDCSKVSTIKDVNDLWDYKDEHGGGKHDAKWVSCGQDVENSGYSELKDKFDKYFDGVAKEKWMGKLMCQCCNELKPTGTEKVSWKDFYKCLLSKVSAEKSPRTYKTIEKLIK